MSKTTRFLPGLAGMAVLTLGCAVPLPAPELTATAESRPPDSAESRAGNDRVQAASTGPVNLTREDDELDAVLEAAVEEPTALVTVTPAPTAAAATPEPVVQPENYASDALAGLNAIRAERGRAALTPNATLSAAATSFARYMATANFFGHAAPDGSTPASRIRAAGFGGLYKGEALSAGQGSPAAALQALMASPQHAAILLEASSVAVGVGYYYSPVSYYKHYWVVITANP